MQTEGEMAKHRTNQDSSVARAPTDRGVEIASRERMRREEGINSGQHRNPSDSHASATEDRPRIEMPNGNALL